MQFALAWSPSSLRSASVLSRSVAPLPSIFDAVTVLRPIVVGREGFGLACAATGLPTPALSALLPAMILSVAPLRLVLPGRESVSPSLRSYAPSRSGLAWSLRSAAGVVISTGAGLLSGAARAFSGEVLTAGRRALVLSAGFSGNVLSALVLLGEVGSGARLRGSGFAASLVCTPRLVGRVVTPLAVQCGQGLETHSVPKACMSLWLVEPAAPSILMRRGVSEPLHTGLLVLDALVPVGLGQRELVVGDRRVGKTSLSIDTLLSQEREGLLCIFASIGQRASSLLRLAFSLFSRTEHNYMVFVAAFSSDRPALQYFCPYSSATLSEYFMWAGQLPVFTTYDDLSRHASCYRELYLLMKRPPGREAYPAEIFFVHSRLLERAAKLALAYGGGSLTCFPVIETLAADVSSYISTNVISITDGQIFLSADLFVANSRPAVDVGLSVTRVGSAAQWGGMKAVAGACKLELAQYFELQAFASFGADLGEDTQARLKRGSVLFSCMKQACGGPYSLVTELALLSACRLGSQRSNAALLLLPSWMFLLASARLILYASVRA